MVRVHLPEPNALDVRDLWDSITSAVGGAFNDDDDKTTTSSAKATKTTAKTVITTETPRGYTGELTTKTTAKAADKTTSTAKKTTTTSEEKTTSTKAAAKTTSTSSTATTEKTTKKATSITATTAASSETLLTLDSGSPTTTSSSTATSTTATASATTSAAATGGSPAAKAGIAIGVLAGLFFVGLAVFLIFRRRQKQQQQRLDDEKNGPFADSAAIPGSKPAGSRLSLRPVTQLFTVGTAVAVGAAGAAGAGAAGAARGGNNNNAASAYPNRRQSRGGINGGSNSIALQNQAPMSNRGPYSNMNRVPGGAAAWGERPMTSQSQNQNNPFGDGAQRLGPNSNNMNVRDNNGISPVSSINSANSYPNNNNTNNGAMAAAGAAAGAYVANNLTRKTSIRKDGPQALDLTLGAPRGVNGNGGLGPVPPSPSGTDYSLNSMAPGQSTSPMAMGSGGAAIAAAGGPAVSAVHRVQLDFKPTLEDELGLRAGQLVRLLHEYDDGWALCIRLDRSQQGVVPRTCLSVRPVKPRPPPNGNARPGPPINTNPNGRPMTPQGGPGGPGGRGPMGPNGHMNGRGPMGPGGPGGPNGPMSQMNNMGRPQSPAGQQRPMTPQGGPGAPRMMMNSNMSSTSMNMQARTQSPSPMYNELPAAPTSASSSKAPSLPPMSFSELPAFNATPSDASRSPSPNSSNRTVSPAPLAPASTANVVFGTAISGPSGGPQSPIEMPVAEVAAAEMPAIGIATSVPAPASDSSPTEYTPGSARVRPVNSIGRKPVPGQAL